MTSSELSAAIDIRSLEKSVPVGFWGRPKHLLRDVTLQVQSGRVFGFIGQNGAGKSTTIKHLVGVMKPSAGTIQVLNMDPSAVEARQNIGYLPELPRLPANLYPVEVLVHHARLLGIPPQERQKTLQQIISDVGIGQFSHQRIRTLSKGNQQRVALALALLGSPKLLILDEPMSGLDPGGRKLVRDLIRREHDRGVTVFFSSHVLSDVESLCDEVAILHEGRILLQGSVASVLHSDHEDWVVSFVGPASDAVVHAAGSALLRIDADLYQWRFPKAEDAWEQAMALRSQGFTVRHIGAEHKTLEERVLQILRGTVTSDIRTSDAPLSPASSTERS